MNGALDYFTLGSSTSQTFTAFLVIRFFKTLRGNMGAWKTEFWNKTGLNLNLYQNYLSGVNLKTFSIISLNFVYSGKAWIIWKTKFWKIKVQEKPFNYGIARR